MKLNRIEFFLVNNPIRAFVQEKHEVKVLRDMASVRTIENALEIGCGNGHGTKLIKKHFKPAYINAVDLDEKMIRIAKRKNKDASIRFDVMDAARLDFADNTFDAVFDFGIIHHIPNWADCISEMYRVLKPGGELVLEELSADTFQAVPGRLGKMLLDHPYEQMFSTAAFVDKLKEKGFELIGFREFNPLGLIRYFFLVAGKPVAS